LRVKEHLQNFLVVSVAYITAYSLVLGFVSPLQQILLSNVILEVSLLFLPHGIRVLSFWFFGWRAAIYLLPAAYLMMVVSAQAGISLDLWSPLGNILACLLGFWIAKAAYPEHYTHQQTHRITGAASPLWLQQAQQALNDQKTQYEASGDLQMMERG